MQSAMQRRKLLMAAGAALSALSTRGFAQARQRVYRVGVLTRSFPGLDFAEGEFIAELSRQGYRVDKNLVLERRSGARVGDLDRLAAELVSARVDAIYAQGGTPVALAAKRATATIPIVFFSSGDPVGLKLVQSLARPGGNLTGSSVQSSGTIPKSIQILAQASGKLTSLAYVHSPDTREMAWYPQYAATATSAARLLGARTQFVDVRSSSELEGTVQRLVREGVDGIAVLGGGSLSDSTVRQLPALLIQFRLPSIGDAESGYLLSYEYSETALARAGARYLAKILAGAKPADLPIEQVSQFELVINMKTARAIGLSLPTEVLVQATRLVE